MLRNRLVMLGVLAVLGTTLVAQDRVEAEEGFPWDIHLITVPLVLLFGVFIGWSLRERKYAGDEARANSEAKS